MTTIIRRQSEIGDDRLPRIPFPEPGPAPFARMSALSHQGANNHAVNAVPDAEGSWAPFLPLNGISPKYRVFSSGQPAIEFDTPASTDYGTSKALFRDGGTAGHPVPLTFVAVFALLRYGDSAATDSSKYGRIVSSGGPALAIRPVHGTDNGELVMTGGSGILVGPKVLVDGDLHFAAGVIDGANSRLHFDNTIVTGNLGASTLRNFYAGQTIGGHRIGVTEAAHYDKALSIAEIEVKRAHYRALYQF